MKAKITVEMDNAAFDEPATELARILRNLAESIEAGAFRQTLVDLNGNAVGLFNISGGRTP